MLSRSGLGLVLAVVCLYAFGCGGETDQPASKTEPETARSDSATPAPQANGSDSPAAEEKETQESQETQPDEAATSEAPTKTAEPASVRRATAMIDLREFPLMPEATEVHSKAALLIYEAPADIPSAVEYHTKELAQLGWEEDTEAAPRRVDEQSAYLGFQREGFFLFLSIKAAEDREGLVQITLGNQGNVDTSRLPKMDEASVLLGGQATSFYETPADLESVVAFTRKELTNLGWQEYQPRFEQVVAGDDSISLRFKQNGISLSAHIRSEGEEKTTVQYDTSVLSHELPTIPDATNVEYDDDLPHLRFTTDSDFERIADFFRRQAETLGWEAKEDQSDVEEGSMRLFFEDAESNLFMLQITKMPDDTTQVTLERVLTQPAESTEEPPAPTEKEEKEESSEPSEESPDSSDS